MRFFASTVRRFLLFTLLAAPAMVVYGQGQIDPIADINTARSYVTSLPACSRTGTGVAHYGAIMTVSSTNITSRCTASGWVPFGALTPLSYGAVCNGTVNYQTNVMTGTDDRAAIRSAIAAALNTGSQLVIPDGKTCVANPPGGIISSFSVTSDVVTVAMPNKLVPGDVVTPNCLSSGTYLNGVPLVVSSTGLSSTQFEASFMHGNVAATTESGGQTTGGRGSWNPKPCPAGSPAIGSSPSFEITKSGLNLFSHGGQILGGQGSSTIPSIGDMFDFDFDKTAQITSASSDSSGTVTVHFIPLQMGDKFFGGALTLAYTGTALDDTYHTCSSVTSNSVVCTGAAGGVHPSLSTTQGAVHEPWSVAAWDSATQGWSLSGVGITLFNRTAGMVMGSCGSFYCPYYPASQAITDWRGGSGIVQSVNTAGFEYGFFGVQSDLNQFEGFNVQGSHCGMYIGPYSTPFTTLHKYDGFADECSIEIDGGGTQPINITDAHFVAGNSTLSPVIVENQQYDITAANGGGVGTSKVTITNANFEDGGGYTNPPSAFVSIDTGNTTFTSTSNVTLISPTLVNSVTALSTNVPYLVAMGPHHSGAQASIDILLPAPSCGTFTGWVNNTDNASPNVLMISGDAGNNSIPIVVNHGSGTGVAQGLGLPITNPTFTGTMTGPKMILQGDTTLGDFLGYIGGEDPETRGYFAWQNGGSPVTPFLYGYGNANLGQTFEFSPSHFEGHFLNGNGFTFNTGCDSATETNMSAHGTGFFYGAYDASSTCRMHWYGNYTDNPIAYLGGSGTTAMPTASIASGTCANVLVSVPGLPQTAAVEWSYQTDFTSVAGYAPSASGRLDVSTAIATGGSYFRFFLCNSTGSAITPGAMTLNWAIAK